MNATIGSDSNGSWSYIGTNNDELPTNDNGSRRLRLSQECQLYIMNSIYHSTTPHRHTWYSPTGLQKEWVTFLQSGISNNLAPIVVFIAEPVSLLNQIIASWHCPAHSLQNINKNCFSENPKGQNHILI